MPLSTQIIRNGEPMSIRWGDFHIAAMALAAAFDVGQFQPGDVYTQFGADMYACYPDSAFPVTWGLAMNLTSYAALAATPLNEGTYTLKGRHTFLDMTDGEVLRLMPGDELHAWR